MLPRTESSRARLDAEEEDRQTNPSRPTIAAVVAVAMLGSTAC